MNEASRRLQFFDLARWVTSFLPLPLDDIPQSVSRDRNCLCHQEIVRGILTEDPRIDRLIQIESTTSLSSLIAELRAEGVDAILDLHGKLRGLALRLCHPFTPSTVIPKPTRVQQFLVRNALTPFRPKHTIVERYYQAAEKLMGEPLKRAPLSLTVPESSYAELAKESDLPLSELQESYLLMPGAQWATKRWPIDSYVSVARELRARGVNIVSAGGPNEEHLLKELEEKGGVRALPRS